MFLKIVLSKHSKLHARMHLKCRLQMVDSLSRPQSVIVMSCDIRIHVCDNPLHSSQRSCENVCFLTLMRHLDHGAIALTSEVTTSLRIRTPNENSGKGLTSILLHIYETRRFHRSWHGGNWSSGCVVTASAGIWVPDGNSRKGLTGQSPCYSNSK